MWIREANMSVKIIPQEVHKMSANKEVPYAAFGARLMELRKNANMTRAELGEICGVAPSTIVNYERGTRIPYADTALKIADYAINTTEIILKYKLEAMRIRGYDIDIQELERYDRVFQDAK